MTPFVQRIVIGLAVLMWLGLSISLPCAAETSQVGSATKQMEGFDHGVSHPLLLLCDAKASKYRKKKAFKDLDHYFEWPKVADAVIKAQMESGARHAGRGIEDTAKGVGNTVVEGAKVAGEKVQEAGRSAQPHAEDTLHKVKDGAEAAGASVKSFVNKLFGK